MPRGTPSARARGRGRGRGRSAASSSPTKRGQKPVVESEDDSVVVDNGSPEEGSDYDPQPRSVNITPRKNKVQVVVPSRNKAPSMSEWVSLEADEDNEVSDSEKDREEEDQLDDEGDEIGSEIDRVSEPDEVAFTRPSTSPIRKSKTMPVHTPPTPSPKKGVQKRSLKRRARVSMESNHEQSASPNVDTVDVFESEVIIADSEDGVIDHEGTPAPRKSRRTRRPVKSATYIADSDVEEIDPKKYKAGTITKAAPPTPTPKPSTRPAVTMVARKIAVSGLKKFPQPIEDADNNPLLETAGADLSLPRSPKKKAKTVHVLPASEEEDEDAESVVDYGSDYDPPIIESKGKQPATPVSRLAATLNKSILDSSKKGKATVVSSRPRAPKALPPSPEDVLFADQNLMRTLSPALKDTYGGLPVIRTNPLIRRCWPKWGAVPLDTLVSATSIGREPDRLKAIAKVVTAPCVGPMIYNPARCHWDDFRSTRKEGRYQDFQYFVTKDTYDTPGWEQDAPVCFLFWGASFSSNLVTGTLISNQSWILKSIGIAPITMEWERTFAFLGYRMGFTAMHVPNFKGNLNFSTRPGPTDATNGSQSGNIYAVDTGSTTYQGSTPIDYHDVIGYNDRLKVFNEDMERTIKGYGLRGDDIIPVYDLTEHFKDTCHRVYDYPLQQLLVTAPRFEGDLPDGCIVGIISLPQIAEHSNQGKHPELRMNLVGIILLAVPFM
ncbi:hypothetical protein BDW22DRAFT_1433652 [Trametopsis cervina]|nr:hypothetical protein BDW22DRAFT_1433652 [Trametopsis cervina]